MKTLPFFVYGTLLPGQPNYDLWKGVIIRLHPAIFPNGRLYDLGRYPVLVIGGTQPVKGQVVWIESQRYHITCWLLDSLEGFNPLKPSNSPYHRIAHQVLLASKELVTAWVYISNVQDVTSFTLIESGDWVEYAALT